MDDFKKASKDYLNLLKSRSKQSKVYKPHQFTGLALADLLNDPEHKSLYMKLSKVYDNGELLRIAKTVSERKNVDRKGAYFMRMLKASDIRKLDTK